ncbi:MAG: peptide deformylase, partial [Candidatus Magnetoovum sp. WYHC-5]|nr:peptide deformylase [Candidatus Magnetoovum sp. WYHC-5]
SEVTEINGATQTLITNMVDTMKSAGGVGLAAPQVNVSKRVIVMEFSHYDERMQGLIVMINPEIVYAEGGMYQEEGCLSVPDFRAAIERSALVYARGIDGQGKIVEIEGRGIVAICLQHEIDHLNGVLFIDRLSEGQSSFFRKAKKIRKIKTT